MIYLDNFKDSGIRLMILNSSGVMVMEVIGSELSRGISLHHLPAGFYLIKGKTGIRKAVARIIKL